MRGRATVFPGESGSRCSPFVDFARVTLNNYPWQVVHWGTNVSGVLGLERRDVPPRGPLIGKYS